MLSYHLVKCELGEPTACVLGFRRLSRETRLWGGAGSLNSTPERERVHHRLPWNVGLFSSAGKSDEDGGIDTGCGLAPQKSQQAAVSSLLGHTA